MITTKCSKFLRVSSVWHSAFTYTLFFDQQSGHLDSKIGDGRNHFPCRFLWVKNDVCLFITFNVTKYITDLSNWSGIFLVVIQIFGIEKFLLPTPIFLPNSDHHHIFSICSKWRCRAFLMFKIWLLKLRHQLKYANAALLPKCRQQFFTSLFNQNSLIKIFHNQIA